MTEKKNAGVILLNGPSSAGKSRIAGELGKKLAGDGFSVSVISIDDYLQMSVYEPIWEDDVFEIVPRMNQDIDAALLNGKTVIVDHVITSARVFDGLIQTLAGYKMKTVLITCSLETLRKREAFRGDRFPGSAEASLQYLYPKNGYDLYIDSGRIPLGEIVEMLADFWKEFSAETE